MSKNNGKPLGRKAYGSIPHLPNSRLGERDYSITQGQANICLLQVRDKHDCVIVTEKLDGSNVAIANIDGNIIALGRAGYLAETSPYHQHHIFAEYVKMHAERFADLLKPNESLHGEWLALAHGTIYKNVYDPFVAFDLKRDGRRILFDEFKRRCDLVRVLTAPVIHYGGACSVDSALRILDTCALYKTDDILEGVVYRVERKGEVDFLAKYVRHNKVDGKYLKGVSSSNSYFDFWNWPGPYI